MNVAIIFGGKSTEYEVSLQSAAAVIEALDPERYEVTLIGITRQGKWLRYEGPVAKIRDGSWLHDGSCVPVVVSPAEGLRLADGSLLGIDVVLPVLHGRNGEDGTVQGLLALAGIPCAGSGVLSSALCMDKEIAHRLVSAAGVPVARSVVLRAPVSDGELAGLVGGLEGPLFVKPANAGSSIGISRVVDRDELGAAVAAAFAHDRKVVIEEAVPGFEVGCAVLGNDELTIGEVDEIELQGGFFDHTEKYSLVTSRIHMPARISASAAARVKETAALIYRVLGCSGFARVDLFLTPDGRIFFNEVNTIPGFTAHSRFPQMLAGIGMGFGEVVDAVIRLAVAQ